MAQWVTWMVAAGVLIVAELFTGTFYLLMLAVGLAAAGLAALIGFQLEWQLIVAAVVAVVAIYILRHSKFGRQKKVKAERDPNINLDIGQSITVDEWHRESGERAKYTARVKYRGAMWDVELVQDAIAQAGVFFIQEIRGSRLIVANSPGKINK
ncbi:NfeD family protein [Paraherbaspirillum soli]|uniref:NfeD family protein n=1 Tax=Paraherbaspirillum soli TaxID=631222 RepID=A0ABW0MBL2_9BURK